MKNRTFVSGPMAGDRKDGAPVDYARYRADVRERLAETDIMLALVLDSDDEQQSFDPYNADGA